MTIYSPAIDIDTFVSEFNALESNVILGNKAKTTQCTLVANQQRQLLEEHGNNPNSKEYKKVARMAIRATTEKKSLWDKYTRIGNYLLDQKDDNLYNESLNVILKLMKPKVIKVKVDKKNEPNNEEALKRINILESRISHLEDRDDYHLEAWNILRNAMGSETFLKVLNKHNIDHKKLGIN
jgi:hypothetical protein